MFPYFILFIYLIENITSKNVISRSLIVWNDTPWLTSFKIKTHLDLPPWPSQCTDQFPMEWLLLLLFQFINQERNWYEHLDQTILSKPLTNVSPSLTSKKCLSVCRPNSMIKWGLLPEMLCIGHLDAPSSLHSDEIHHRSTESTRCYKDFSSQKREFVFWLQASNGSAYFRCCDKHYFSLFPEEGVVRLGYCRLHPTYTCTTPPFDRSIHPISRRRETLPTLL